MSAAIIQNKKKRRRIGLLRSLFNALHAYVYGRWTKTSIGLLRRHVIPRLSTLGKIKLADGFHCKVLTLEHAEAIVSIDKNISRRDLEQIIPYTQARTFILKAPPDIALYECACRHTRKHHCEPTRVCMMMGQPVVDFILKHHPDTSRRIGRTEALELLRAEHERGHVHTAWFKDAVGGRFYALCNCCKCCCFGIEAITVYGTPMVASSGFAAKVNPTLCRACSTCSKTCPFMAIHVDGKAAVDWNACMGCGVCVGQCPRHAVSLERDERKGVPLDVRLLE